MNGPICFYLDSQTFITYIWAWGMKQHSLWFYDEISFLISVSRWYWSRPAKGHRSGEARRTKAKVQPAIEKSWVGFIKQQNAQGRVDHFCQRGYHNRTQNQNCAARVPLASNILLCRWQGREKIFQLYRQRCGFQPAYMFCLSQGQTGKNTLDLLDFVWFRL